MAELNPETGLDIGMLSMDGDSRIEWLLQNESHEMWPDVSANGRWLAYATDESGRFEILVRPFPNVNNGRWQVSQDGGHVPQWGPDGRELFYQTSDGAIMVTEIVGESPFDHATPVRLFDGPYLNSEFQLTPRAFDIHPDGQRLLMIKEAAATDTEVELPDVNIVVNWTEDLKRLVPID